MKKKKNKRTRKISPRLSLLSKIKRIRLRIPQIHPTGECKDPQTGEVLFHFTEAQHVFDIYRTECMKEKIIVRPYAEPGVVPVVIAVGGMVMLAIPFCIEDLETGFHLVGYGCGMGANRDWSGNTAHTRALKQFLLTTFQTTWKDPEFSKDVLGIKELASQATYELGDYFSDVMKEKLPKIKKAKTPKKQIVQVKRVKKKGRKK